MPPNVPRNESPRANAFAGTDNVPMPAPIKDDSVIVLTIVEELLSWA